MTKLAVTVNRVDTRTENQVDSLYEDVSTLKTAAKETQADIVLIKKHVGMAA